LGIISSPYHENRRQVEHKKALRRKKSKTPQETNQAQTELKEEHKRKPETQARTKKH
jgi:hypothetical protein